MAQQLLVGYGPTGFQLEMLGPEGPVRAILGVGPAGPVVSVLTFNTISAGVAGSGRLIDIPTPQFLALPTGTLAYTGNSSATVPSVHSYWRRMTSPTGVSSDGITVVKPLGGASREIWVRLPDPSDYYWQQRLAGIVVVDAGLGSDENFGNVGAPLQSEAEAVRRLGPGLFNTFVFQPGGSNQFGNVYNDWSQLVAAAALVPGPKTIIFDDSLGACVIPVGAWDFGRYCAFVGMMPNLNGTPTSRVEVTCADGVTFTTPIFRVEDIRLTYTGTNALMTVPNDLKVWRTIVSGFGRLNCSGAAGRIYQLQPNNVLNVLFKDSATATVSGGGFLADATGGDATTTLQIDTINNLLNTVTVPANALKGPVGPVYVFDATVNGQFATGQASMPGGVVTVALLLNTSTRTIAYTPANGANWVDPDPTTVNAAIDRIANVVAAGGATPIP